MDRLLRLCLYTFLIGVGTGLGAAGLVWLMHAIEQLVYGQHEGNVAIVTEGTTSVQRFVGIVLAGLIAGPAWAIVRTHASPIRSVEEGMAGIKMPVLPTLANVVLQMSTVAAGSSVGRENAPREAGAMMASQLSSALKIDAKTRRILVAAAAGAGLGAVYHIPLAGAIFSLEILLGSVSVTAIMVVLACSAVATVTSGIIVGTNPLYNTVNLSEGWGNLAAAVLLGVVCGTAGLVFRTTAAHAEAKAPKGWHAAWAIPVAFAVVGTISIWVPQVLGNGRIAASEVLQAHPMLSTVSLILAVKVFAVLITFRSGAVGGVLTPGFAIGALFGFLCGSFVQPALMPSLPLSDFAILGAAAFLSASMSAPLFALIVTVEFTGQSSEAYLALFLAAATASLTVAIWRSLLKFPKDQVLPWTWPRNTSQR